MRLLHVADAPLSVPEIAAGLGQSLRRACHHLQMLRRRGLVALVVVGVPAEARYVSRVKNRAMVSVFLEQDRTDAADLE
jgi:hypothetical protein